MAYNARTFQILIASPSDVDEFRDLAVRGIQEWNNLHSKTRQTVLLPLRWETHTAPTYGMRPQDVINRSIVDDCDLVVGIFWGRIGTPTGQADSGTLEEIERAVRAGKPVMIYFSRGGIDPDEIDTDQIERLKRFKKDISPNALTESFKSGVDFLDKFSKQLEIKVRELQDADSAGVPCPLRLQIVTPSVERPGQTLECNVIYETIADVQEALTSTEFAKRQSSFELAIQKRARRNDVLVDVDVVNDGVVGIRNVHAEMQLQANPCGVVSAFVRISPTSGYPAPGFGPPGYMPSGFGPPGYVPSGFGPPGFGPPGYIAPANPLPGHFPDTRSSGLLPAGPYPAGESFDGDFDWDAIQPKRTLRVQKGYLFAAMSTTTVQFRVRIYAENFPTPVDLTACIRINVERRVVSFRDILPELEKAMNEIWGPVPQVHAASLPPRPLPPAKAAPMPLPAATDLLEVEMDVPLESDGEVITLPDNDDEIVDLTR